MTKRLKKIYIKLTDYSISRNKVTQNQEENHEEMSLFSALGDMKDGQIFETVEADKLQNKSFSIVSKSPMGNNSKFKSLTP